MLSLDLSEARDVSERAARGDAEAIAFLSSLFPDTEPCLLCDEPVGAEGTIVMVPDPKAHGWAIVAAECLRCAGSPQRHQREVAVLKGMFPRSKFPRATGRATRLSSRAAHQAAILKAKAPPEGTIRRGSLQFPITGCPGGLSNREERCRINGLAPKPSQQSFRTVSAGRLSRTRIVTPCTTSPVRVSRHIVSVSNVRF